MYIECDVSIGFGFRAKKLVIVIPDRGNNTAFGEIVAVQSHFGCQRFDNNNDAGCFNGKYYYEILFHCINSKVSML